MKFDLRGRVENESLAINIGFLQWNEILHLAQSHLHVS